MGNRSGAVSFAELSRMLRLVGELRDLPRGSPLQRRHAVKGLCDLVGAKVGMWLDIVPRDGGLFIRGAIDVGWGSERERQAFMSYLDAQPRSVDPSHAPLRELMRAPLVIASRRQVVDDRAWYGSDHVQEFRRAGGVDDFMYTGRRAAHGLAVHGMSLHRPWGERGFGERERSLVDAFHRESAWLYEPPAIVAEVLLADLSPRQRDVLRGLARGLSEKQLAAELQLSPHTVHDYVKALYRRFEVASRAELLALCLRAS